MCGIAGGAWTSDGEPLSRDGLQRMAEVLRHRGPDDEGVFLSGGGNGGAGLAFRRLSIIDLTSGHQPLANEDESVWVVLNGEIYNYRELRSELESRGHQFRTQSDTETIVHLYEEHGDEFVTRLRGMFAIALWDETRRRLLLARDRIGQKPLFYRHDAQRLVFASELKSLLEVPGAPRELDPESLDLFLTYQYVPHPRCILKGYAKLPPGHLAVYEQGRLDVRRYWQAPYCDDSLPECLSDTALADSDQWSDDEWRRQLRETLTEAVRLRMRSDVPLGAFLSGGIDSTIITGLMQSLSERPVHSFSIGFPVEQFDERSYAREAAEHLGTEHHEYVVEPSALEILQKLVWHYDEPFGDSSAIPTMALCEVTRREVTVALSGDGGDELFCGYPRYNAVRLAARIDRLPVWMRRAAGWDLWQKIPSSVEQKSLRRRGKKFLAAIAQPAEERYLRWIGIFDEGWRRRLYTDAFREELGGFDSAEFIRSAYAMCGERDIVTRTTCADVHSYLPCDILTKVDIASMAYSLEARSPFLDHHVAELAARMPLRLKQRGSRGKVILTETFRDLLPKSIQNRGKMGFGVPIDHWFRNELRPLVRDTLLDSTARSRGYFEPATVERLIEEHETAQFDHAYRLWHLLVFEQWQRAFLG
ncbi:MAG: asparagine synthase (glutamine-hydrolyzing) [Planctomycetota bacterium]|nr:MAG: asparagine synthase (glutamine-hydrolyzing) [Planctomycetota bacterium]REK32985.1 MAG: asparagine synthase (glutamine-hydrolyzing) [Planctomycetota bacterium]